jgi:hypothetical protein
LFLQKPVSGSDLAEPFKINHLATPKSQCALSLVGNEIARDIILAGLTCKMYPLDTVEPTVIWP